MFVSPLPPNLPAPNPEVEILTPKNDGIRGGGLGFEGGPFINEINALRKETPQSFPAPSTM